jgi:hypothetical protein
LTGRVDPGGRNLVEFGKVSFIGKRLSAWQNGQRKNVEKKSAESSLSHKNVETRASGRPPEEADSDNPEAQAQAILEDSEDRKRKRAHLSEDAGDS